MTKDQKIKLLTGATAIAIDRHTDRFYFFTEIEEEFAKRLITTPGMEMGVCVGGQLWIIDNDTRWIIADTRLAVIAE